MKNVKNCTVCRECLRQHEDIPKEDQFGAFIELSKIKQHYLCKLLAPRHSVAVCSKRLAPRSFETLTLSCSQTRAARPVQQDAAPIVSIGLIFENTDIKTNLSLALSYRRVSRYL